MKLSKFSFIVIGALLWNVHAHAQTPTTPDLNKALIPPSPDAAAIAKYGLLPVTLYEGSPNVSVPVYDIKSAKLSLSVQLSYNYNGYRPGEEASWVGLGWSVQAGGCITRVVKGMVDDDDHTYYQWREYADIMDITGNLDYLARAGTRLADTEPDLYIFNFNGHTGKFILVGDRAFMLTPEDIRITQVGQGFTIVDEQGVKYSFQVMEQTNPNNSTNPGSYMPLYNSAFYLTTMISSDNTDTIKLQYADWTYRQPSVTSESYQETRGGTKNGIACTGTNTSCDTWVVSTAPGAQIYAKQLSSVSWRGGNINFVPETSARLDIPGATNGYALKQIDVYNKPNNTLLRRMQLVHGYYNGNTQLKLAGVNLTGYYVNNIINSTVTSDSTVLNNYYGFNYVNENTGSFPKVTRGIDMFGYYNGKDGNGSLFDNSIATYTLGCPVADRSVDSSKSTNGILSKITYPTGGYTTFSYQLNRMSNGAQTSQHQAMEVTRTMTYDGTHDPSTGRSIQFAINESQSVHAKWGRNITAYPNGVFNNYYILNLYQGGDEEGGSSTLIYTSPRLGKAESLDSATISLQPGSYYYTVSCESTSASAFGTIDYDTLINVPPIGNPGPGLRIASIQSYDNVNTAAASTKLYSYKPGTLMYGGFYGMTQVLHQAVDSFCHYTTPSEYIFTGDGGSSLGTLIGTQFYYPTVTEVNYNASGAGKTVYYYENGLNDALGIALIRQSDSVYTSGGFIAAHEKITTDTVINPINFWAANVHMSEISDDPQGNCPNIPLPSPDLLDTVIRYQLYQADPYVIPILYRRNSSTDEISYNQSGQNPMTMHTDFYYDNPNYLQPSRMVTNNSKGQLVTTQIKYPLDYSFATCTSSFAIDTSFRYSRDTSAHAYEDCIWSRYQAATPYYDPNTPNYSNTALLNVLRSYQCETKYETSYAHVISTMNSMVDNYPACFDGYRQASYLSDSAHAIVTMEEFNIKQVPIETIVSVNRSGTDYLLAATKTDFTIRNTYAVAPKILYETPITNTTTKSSFTSNPNSFYQPRVSFKYDALDNIAEQSKTKDVKMAYLWDYAKMYPVAQAVNADSADIAYTSFESDGTGTWTFASGGVTGSVKGITGGKSYTLTSGAVGRTGLNTAKRYTVSYWLKTGGTASVSNSAAPTSGFAKNGWTYYSTTTNASASSISITGSGNIDEVRLYPIDAQMTTYCYDPLIGENSICSPNNTITYFEYDPLARLRAARDADLNIAKLYDYKYQVNSATLPATTPITGQNLVAVSGFTIKYTNVSSGVVTTFNISSAGGTQTVGNLAPGVYNVVISKTGNSTTYYFGIHSNSCSTFLTSVATSGIFSNVTVSVTSCNDFKIDSPF